MCQLLPRLCPPKPESPNVLSKGKLYCAGTEVIEMPRIFLQFKEREDTMKEVLFTLKVRYP